MKQLILSMILLPLSALAVDREPADHTGDDAHGRLALSGHELRPRADVHIADGGRFGDDRRFVTDGRTADDGRSRGRRPPGTTTGAIKAPELDASSSLAALTLLLGTIAMVRGRRAPRA